MMEKEFIPYEQALALKELGFDEPCFRVYDTLGFVQDEKVMDKLSLEKIQSPTFSQAFRWFREKHSLYSCVNTFTEELNDDIPYFIYEIRNPEQFELSEVYKTYEEAELDCLKKLIKIVKDGK